MAFPPKVLISDKMSAQAAEIFKARGIDVTVATDLTPEELKSRIASFDGLAIRSSTKVTADVLQAAAGRLKVIGRAGIGVDNVDLQAATTAGVVVMNTPFGNSVTTAEHTIALMMSLARQIPQADISTRAGKWEKNRFMGQEISGKTLGIIGCGNIGAIVADRALGLRMKVIACDPFLSPERAVEMGVEKVELDDLLRRSDYITLHTPMTDATRGLIDKTALARMKKGVRIINCARGGLVVEEDLKDALESGHVAGAALDVFAEEPAHDNPLFKLDNVICTPHLGAATVEAQENVALQVASQMADFLTTGAVVNALNMPALSAEDAPKIAPYMKLAELLGCFAGQAAKGGDVREISIDCEGDVAALNIRPLVSLCLAHLLSASMEGVNIVNAPLRARERGIAISETRREKADPYHSLIRVSVRGDTETHHVAGTVFAGALPRIVMVDGVPTEAGLGPHMLYIRNLDQPGLIGSVGTILAQAGVNIGDFNLGRIAGQGRALALVAVDTPLNADVIEKIAALPQVEHVQALHFPL